ncbi:MAG: hypothetical protein GJU76_10610 [Gallionella sp.]|jgi:hypothetical protein|nr:hypothetical protein [Gallionella sp.]
MILLLKRIAAAPRWLVYVSSSLLVVLTSYHLGKAMSWDMMEYHVYAGFSALHNRFHQDYFAAGPQGYFNPYAYVPFYLLLRSSLPPLAIASILALVQSAILWLTYELALRVVPPDTPNVRVAIAILAVVFAFANPVLINELGSSYSDITTAELALAGWLLLVDTVWTPSAWRVFSAALLLGVATGLKPTNAVHAVSAAILLLFIPGGWIRRFRYGALYGLTLAAGFVLINLPWSIQLERHFGNPVFPLLNGWFRSPDYLTGSILDHRFIPATLGAALLRPFTMVLPISWIHFEMPAPDLRYALLLVLSLLLLSRWLWLRLSRAGRLRPRTLDSSERALGALGLSFLVDWALWLPVSGNSRYFMPMACVAAVLCVALIFRLFSARPALRNGVLVAMFAVQFFQLYAGTEYRQYLPWHGRHWFTLSVPSSLESQADLYFLIGGQTNSFIIPELPRASGFVNLSGQYELGPEGANGRHISDLIRRYAPHLRAVWSDPAATEAAQARPSFFDAANDALEPFGLKVDPKRCSMIVARGVDVIFMVGAPIGHRVGAADGSPDTKHLMSCRVNRDPSAPVRIPGQRTADAAFDHLEDACPALFQPRRPGDVLMGDAKSGYLFLRKYTGSAVHAWIAHGIIRFQKLAPGGREEDAGSERMWARSPPRVACGWQGAGLLKILPP